MEKTSFLKLAVSSLLVATTLSSCSGIGLFKRAPSENAQTSKQLSSDAASVEKALAEKDAGKAIAAAESVVSADGANPAYRALLGRAYLLGGRYESAQTAFEDAMTLGNREPRTIVSLALVKISQGQSNSARDLLYSNIDQLPAADYGLGMAMAGDTNEAIRVLSQAVQDPASGAKERQNLAYSYALAGNWSEARSMAERDLDPTEASKRVLSWAATAQQGAEAERVVALLGVRPQLNDAGMPSALALNGDTARAAQMAAADPAPTQAPSYPAPAYEPASAPQFAGAQTASAKMSRDPILEFAPAPPSAHTATANAKAVTPHARPVGKPAMASAQPVTAKSTAKPKAAPVQFAAAKAVKPATSQTKTAFTQPASSRKSGNWVVQLGAYGNSAGPDARYVRASLQKAAVGSASLVTSTVKIGGKTYQRLSVAGFESRQSANAACSAIRARGSACFVRAAGVNKPAPKTWAMANPNKKSAAVTASASVKAKPVKQVAVATKAKAPQKMASRKSGDFIIEEVGKPKSSLQQIASR